MRSENEEVSAGMEGEKQKSNVMIRSQFLVHPNQIWKNRSLMNERGQREH